MRGRRTCISLFCTFEHHLTDLKGVLQWGFPKLGWGYPETIHFLISSSDCRIVHCTPAILIHFGVPRFLEYPQKWPQELYEAYHEMALFGPVSAWER